MKPFPDPGFRGRPALTKEDAEALLGNELGKLEGLQERFFAERKRSLLVILQGMDCSGKGGTIKNVGGAIYPAGFRVVSFKVPSAEELAHDFLWRIHRETPRRGEIVFFDRSHYEDVLVVRVEGLVPEKIWRPRYEQINAFERHLAQNGTAILKFFLHISKAEQRERLEKRRDDPTKQWKLSLEDLEKRKRWADYSRAYRDAVRKCDTKWAPWIVVPADHKWYRNLVVAREIGRALTEMDPRYPRPARDLRKVVIR